MILGRGLKLEKGRRGELQVLQVRVEAGSMVERRRVVGLGLVAGRAGVEVGEIRTVRVRGQSRVQERVGRGSRGCS